MNKQDPMGQTNQKKNKEEVVDTKGKIYRPGGDGMYIRNDVDGK